ncbi:MAG: HK97 family phage prohead protease [bacterium]
MSELLKPPKEFLSLDGRQELLAAPGFVTHAADDSGIVDAYVALIGVPVETWITTVFDRGAFKKTIQERGPLGSRKIRLLWAHWDDHVIGRPLEMLEHTKRQLPAELLERWPMAQGGLFVRSKFNLDVRRARDEYALYRDGDKFEWSAGFNSITETFVEIELPSGVIEKVRHIKEARLWEYSTATWGRDPATMTVAVNSKDMGDDIDTPEQDQAAEPSGATLTVNARAKRLLHVRLLEHKLKWSAANVQ